MVGAFALATLKDFPATTSIFILCDICVQLSVAISEQKISFIVKSCRLLTHGIDICSQCIIIMTTGKSSFFSKYHP